MELYALIKLLHVLGASVLFGTGLGIAYFMWTVHRSGDVAAIATVTRRVVLADFLFTAPAVVLQPLTGAWMVQEAHFAWTSPWIVAALALYLLTGACWLPVVGLQMRAARLAREAMASGTPLPPGYHRALRWWFALGWPAFVAVLAIFWLMIRKPMGA